VNYVIYVNVVINEMCMGHVKKRFEHVSVASGCDCEQNHTKPYVIVSDNVA